MGVECLLPEVTVSTGGVFWHPLASPSSTDMQVSRQIFPLAVAVESIHRQLDQILDSGAAGPEEFT